MPVDGCAVEAAAEVQERVHAAVGAEVEVLGQAVAVEVREAHARAIHAEAGENEAQGAPADFCGVGAVVVGAAGVEPGGYGAVGVDDEVLCAAVAVEVGEMDLVSAAADGGGDDALWGPVDEGVFGVGDVVVGGVRVGEAIAEVGGCGAVGGEPEVFCAAVAVEVGEADGGGGGDGHGGAAGGGAGDGFGGVGGVGAVGAGAGVFVFGTFDAVSIAAHGRKEEGNTYSS